jgi:hypothetical protein
MSLFAGDDHLRPGSPALLLLPHSPPLPSPPLQPLLGRGIRSGRADA